MKFTISQVYLCKIKKCCTLGPPWSWEITVGPIYESNAQWYGSFLLFIFNMDMVMVNPEPHKVMTLVDYDFNIWNAPDIWTCKGWCAVFKRSFKFKWPNFLQRCVALESYYRSIFFHYRSSSSSSSSYYTTSSLSSSSSLFSFIIDLPLNFTFFCVTIFTFFLS